MHRTPWEKLAWALETDHAELAVIAMLELARIGESPTDIERWVVAQRG